MTYTVTRSSGVMVQPCESTPSGTLNLSVIDKLPMLQVNPRTLHVFRHGHEVGKVVREALSKALVPYYPLAGRLIESSEGELQIACTGDGVWFVEASSDCTLDFVNYFDNVPLLSTDDLYPPSPPKSYDVNPLIQLQITSFACKGFTVGLVDSHTVIDGLGSVQFHTAVGEFARGFLHPTIAPVWHRDRIPAPAKLTRALGDPKLLPLPQPSTPSYQLEYACTDFSLSQINKLKNEYLELTGKHCSTFDVVAATLWRQRTRALDLEKHTVVILAFAINARQILNPPLPTGFYGNCIFPASVSISSGCLLKASNAEVVKLIKDAKDRAPTEFTKWIKSNEVDDSDDVFAISLYHTLYLSDWRHLGIDQIDYGWGHSVNVIAAGGSIVPAGLVGVSPTVNNGTRLMTWCVTKEHLSSFLYHADNITSDIISKL
ncbi:hypothetical protein AQUCO_01200191v1 [Aquilegia coerulea]|uniref:Uncharacterized protein n=1 Tax=Aquilegia coerulea TaxID=218851 RepID=A0A2G5E4Q8_AQUCA|nr:hypothetical protein AQUCO_01200191v1 [Aquilegia coerulea]